MSVSLRWVGLAVCATLFAANCTTSVNHRRTYVPGTAKPRTVYGIAKRYVGVPYRYGGKSPRTGFDCSGYTRYVYARAGYRIPAGARNQFRRLHPVRQPRRGDLVFFRTAGSRISHVGIYAGNHRFLHAPRTGKRVGYADMRKKYWRKRYAGARSVLAPRTAHR